MPTIGSGYVRPKVVNIAIRLGHTKVEIRIDYPNGETMKVLCVPEKKKHLVKSAIKNVMVGGYSGPGTIDVLVNDMTKTIDHRCKDRTILEVLSRLAHIASTSEGVADTISTFETDDWR